MKTTTNILGSLCFILAIFLTVRGSAQNLSDYRIQPGSVSLENSLLRREVSRNHEEASPRTRASFRIQQVGSTPGGFITSYPWRFRFTSNSNGQSYLGPYRQTSISTNTNATALVEVDVFPPNGMPLGGYTLEVLLDPDQSRTDLNRNNDTAVISSGITYVSTLELTIRDIYNTGPDEEEIDAGENVSFRFLVTNSGEPVPFTIAVPVDLYLAPINRGFLNTRPSRSQVLSSPHARYWTTVTGYVSQNFVDYSVPLPADLDLLNYGIAAIPNPDLTLTESSPRNPSDIGSSFINFIKVEYVYKRPDLAVDLITSVSPLSLAPGDTISVSGRYGNYTEFASPQPSTLTHYLIDDADRDLRYFLGSTPTLPLIAAPIGGSATRTYAENFTVPANIPQGRSYRYQVVIDELDLIPERFNYNASNSEDADNIDHFATSEDYEVFITRIPLPDLAPNSSNRFTSSSRSSGEVGQSLTLNASIRNLPAGGSQLGGPASSFQVQFFLQPANTPNSENLRFGLPVVLSTGSLAEGATTTVTLNTSIPDLPPGNYRLGYEIDPNGLIEERPFEAPNLSLNEPDNLFTILPTIPLLPDLAILEVEALPEEADYDKDITVSFPVNNLGDGLANLSEAEISLRAIADDASSAIFVQRVDVAAIDPGKSGQVSVTFSIPEPNEDGSTPVGSFYWALEVGRNLSESDETNNFANLEGSRLRLIPSDESLLPDFEVKAARVNPLSVLAGDEVTTYFELRNAGFYTASQVQVELYLSTTTNFTPSSDILLASPTPFDLTGETGAHILSPRVSLSSSIASGDYHVLWVIDRENAIPRMNQDGPLVVSEPLTIRQRDTRLEILEILEESVLLALYDPVPDTVYTIHHGTDAEKLEPNFDTEGTSFDNAPLFYEIPIESGEESRHFFRPFQK
jgi:hypothetical protein